VDDEEEDEEEEEEEEDAATNDEGGNSLVVAAALAPARELQNKLHDLQEKKRQMDELIGELRLLRQEDGAGDEDEDDDEGVHLFSSIA
jgi:hypothetical protein